MKALWAPWRMEYILGEKEKYCIFCVKPLEKNDRDNLVLYRDKNVFVMMNKYPYNNGHLMVLPYFHTSSFEGLDDDTLKDLMTLRASTSVSILGRPPVPESRSICICI